MCQKVGGEGAGGGGGTSLCPPLHFWRRQPLWCADSLCRRLKAVARSVYSGGARERQEALAESR